MNKQTLLRFINRILRYNDNPAFALSELYNILKAQSAPAELVSLVQDANFIDTDAQRMVREKGDLSEADIRELRRREEQRREQERLYRDYGRC